MKRYLLILCIFCFTGSGYASAIVACESPVDSEETTETTVEIKTEPLFRYWKKNGVEEFTQWFGRQLTMPTEAMASGTVGEAEFTFIVDAEGRITDLEILSSTHPNISTQIREIMDISPDWKKPAYDTEGRPQPFLVRVPVRFQLNKAYN